MTSAATSEIYCLDSDALINIQRYYPDRLKKLGQYAKKGKIVIAAGVFREICRKTDRLKRMVETWHDKYDAVKHFDTESLRTELRRMEIAYGESIRLGGQTRKGFWKSRSGKLSADAQVVAVSKVNGYIAVSNDQAIQDACHLENIPCIGWQEFYRRMDEGLTGQTYFC